MEVAAESRCSCRLPPIAMAGAMMICDCELQEPKLRSDETGWFVPHLAKDRSFWPWETRTLRYAIRPSFAV